MAELLTYDKQRLMLFDNGIAVNESLPKWKHVYDELAKDVSKLKTKSSGVTIVPYTTSNNSTSNFVTPDDMVQLFTDGSTPEIDKDDELGEYNFSKIASLSLLELNKYVKENGLSYYLRATGKYNNTWNAAFGDSLVAVKEGKYKKTFWGKVKDLFAKEEKDEVPEFDAIQFFANIKATYKESAEGYINRIEKYLIALHNAKAVGQTALYEKLVREMITNKYESFLAAEGYYHVVTEEQMVDFINKTEKGIAIDYLSNFVRPIPADVIEKINKASELEVFDNYVIVHYDPDGKGRQDTAKEEYKKRDPIVFGVIAGSSKLYYITDWIDDYCDLTLEKFVDTLKITKDDLVIDEIEKENIKKRKEQEKKEKAEKKPAAKKTTAKKTSKKKKENKE